MSLCYYIVKMSRGNYDIYKKIVNSLNSNRLGLIFYLFSRQMEKFRKAAKLTHKRYGKINAPASA